MKERKEAGEQVDSKNIIKHKNDIFRLLANVTPSSRVKTVGDIQSDIFQFISKIKEDQPDLKNLGLRNVNIDEMLQILEGIFLGGV